MEERKLKSLKVSEPIHALLKIHAAHHKLKNLVSFVDAAVLMHIQKREKEFVSKKKN